MKTNGHNILKLGMKVIYRGSWGQDDEPKEATVEYIDLCECEHEKYGESVDRVFVKDIDRCCLTLSDGHWAYGYQITEIVE
jgi:hypothetical protein